MINFDIHDGKLFLVPSFIPPQQADIFAARLMNELAWQEEDIIIAGQRIKVTRLVCWYGDPGASYRYSGIDHQPLPWNDILQTLKQDVENYCDQHFNSVLGNLYRNGHDSMVWHTNREKELGPEPFIASLSFGAERLFKIRHNKTKEILDIALPHGSLLVMAGRLQHHWRHAIPKSRVAKAARVNLTFRTILL